MRTAQNKLFIIFFSVLLSATVLFPSASSAAFVTGKLETIKGMRVLTLWGTPYQKGYAHGSLLAEDIYDLLENYMLEKMFDTDNYLYTSLLLMYYVRLPLLYQREIQGLYDGMKAVLGDDGMYSPKLYRDFLPIDLVRWNMLDVLPLRFEDKDSIGSRGMCSSLSGWGAGTEDGSLIMARNLDLGYPDDKLEHSGLIIVHDDRSWFFPKKDWVSFAWPGAIGCISGMNEDGVGAMTHYANSNPSVEDLMVQIPWLYTPMTLVLRDALESRFYGLSRDPIHNFHSRIGLSLTAGSYNIHVFTPYKNGPAISDPPAAVIEGNTIFAVRRTAGDNDWYTPKLESDTFLATTNHHRKMLTPVECERYDAIVAQLNALDTLDVDTAWEIETSVVQEDGPYHTLHMMAFDADAREIWLSFSDGEKHPYELEPVHFTWDDFFPSLF